MCLAFYENNKLTGCRYIPSIVQIHVILHLTNSRDKTYFLPNACWPTRRVDTNLNLNLY